MPGNFGPFEAKMRADGLSDAAVAAFKNAYDALTSGAPRRGSRGTSGAFTDRTRRDDAADATRAPHLHNTTVSRRRHGHDPRE
jgi:hypothetical protein